MTGLKEDLLEKMYKRISGDDILSCLIYKEDKLVFEYYKNDRSDLQRINSCTKSVLSALIGIAIDQGLMEGVHLPISEFFGEILGKVQDKRKQKITIEHLLTMTPGMDWPELEDRTSINYISPE